MRCWNELECFEAMISDMRSIIRNAADHTGQSSAVVFDGRTLRSSSCESDLQDGYGDYKCRRDSRKVHMGVYTLRARLRT